MTAKNSEQQFSGGANRSGEPCILCGHRTHLAEHDGERWFRCTTDSCPKGWYRDG